MSISVRIEWALQYILYPDLVETVESSYRDFLSSSPLYCIPTALVSNYKSGCADALFNFASSLQEWSSSERTLSSHYVLYSFKTMISSVLTVPAVNELKIHVGRKEHNWSVSPVIDLQKIAYR